MSDDGLCCTSITISTSRFVQSVGAICPAPYLLQFGLENGTTQSVYCGTLARIAQLVLEFSPKDIRIHACSSEEEEEVIRSYVFDDVSAGRTIQ